MKSDPLTRGLSCDPVARLSYNYLLRVKGDLLTRRPGYRCRLKDSKQSKEERQTEGSKSNKKPRKVRARVLGPQTH